MNKIKKVTLLTIGTLFILYIFNPIFLPIFNSPVVFPNIIFKKCPLNYSYPFSMSTGKEATKKICNKNKKSCKSGDIWLPKNGDCTPDIIGCVFDSPCNCLGSWNKKDYFWVCGN